MFSIGQFGLNNGFFQGYVNCLGLVATSQSALVLMFFSGIGFSNDVKIKATMDELKEVSAKRTLSRLRTTEQQIKNIAVVH